MNNWDRIHKLYYSKASWIKKCNPSAEELLDYIKSNTSILDIGGGQGQDTKFFIENGHDVTLLDGSQQAIKYAKDRIDNENVCFVEHDLNSGRLPFEDNTFDAVYGHLSLHYFNKKRTLKIFKEINRVLKERGVVFVVCNTQADEEIGGVEIVQLEKNFYEMPDGQKKRYFCVKDFRDFTNGLFKEKICDNRANTYKDGNKGLSRFI